MSDIIKLKIKSKSLKAIVTDDLGNTEGFTELPAVLEREKQEHTHKLELENEFNKGYKLGEENTTKDLQQKHAAELLNQSKDFYNILATFEDKIKVFENEFHKLVIHVSERIAEKIIQKEFDNNSIIEKTLDQNLRKIIGANDIIIKLNPTDFELIQKSSKEYLVNSGITKIKFESNENILPGGCFIESEIGNLDARIEAQIREIIKSLESKFVGSNLE